MTFYRSQERKGKKNYVGSKKAKAISGAPVVCIEIKWLHLVALKKD
jgi:hypothetical protein